MDQGWQQWADERIKKHDKDLYEGNGKPSVTVRMDRVERYCESQHSWLKAIVSLLLGAIATGVVDVVLHHR